MDANDFDRFLDQLDNIRDEAESEQNESAITERIVSLVDAYRGDLSDVSDALERLETLEDNLSDELDTIADNFDCIRKDIEEARDHARRDCPSYELLETLLDDMDDGAKSYVSGIPDREPGAYSIKKSIETLLNGGN